MKFYINIKKTYYKLHFSVNLLAKLSRLFLNSFYSFSKSLEHNKYTYLARSHCIEKGFSAKNRKANFGNSYIIKENERKKIDTYYEHQYLKQISDDLEKYNYNNNNLLSDDISTKYLYREKKRKKIDKNTKANFLKYFRGRFSIRYFEDYKIPKKEINEICKYAFSAPSACNRQPYFLNWIQNKFLIKEILKVQGGSRTFIDNVYNLVLVLADRDAVLNHNEVIQPTICSSLMAMLLVQGLDIYGYGSVTLAMPDNQTKWIKIKKLISKNHNYTNNSLYPIMIIACGKPLKNQLIPPSIRRPYKDMINIIT